MIEMPIAVAISLAGILLALGVLFGWMLDDVTRDGRRKRALAKVSPVWEVHVGSDRSDFVPGFVGTGDSVIVCVRKVLRAGQHFELLQKVEVARVRGNANPDEILTAVDRAQAMVSTLALTGAA